MFFSPSESLFICTNLDKSFQTVDMPTVVTENSPLGVIAVTNHQHFNIILIQYLLSIYLFHEFEWHIIHFTCHVPMVQTILRGIHSYWLDHLFPSNADPPLGEQVFVIICHL